MLEIRDDHYIKESIYLIDPANRIYVARVRWRRVILEAVDGESKEEYSFETVEIKRSY